MKLIGVLLFNLLLFNGYLTANINRNSTHNDVHHQNSTENSTTASGLNEHSEYSMFENSNMIDMVKFAKDPQYSEIVRTKIFPIKYGHFDFFIRPDPADDLGRADEGDNYISLSGHSFYMEILEYFGKSIQRLHISNIEALNDTRNGEIHHQVNEYCWESLESLSLVWIRGIMLEQFKKPFPNLKSFSFFLNAEQIGSFETLDEMFPKLQQLNIAYKEAAPNATSGDRFIESDVPHMPHLVELSIYNELEKRLDVPIVEKQVEQLIEKNPQIRHLKYSHNKRCSFINVIKKYLPNIEYLDTWNIAFDIEPIQFDHVKQLVLGPGPREPVEKLFFPSLRSLGVHFGNDADNEEKNMTAAWMTFFRNHPNLKQLNATTVTSGFAQFVSELSNLEEININAMTSFKMDEITRMIEDHPNLVRLWCRSTPLFQPVGPNEAELVTFNEKFGDRYDITYVSSGWPVLTFEKKN